MRALDLSGNGLGAEGAQALAESPQLAGLRSLQLANNNVRDTGAFCVNVATEDQLEALNRSSGEYAPEVDEFALEQTIHDTGRA